MLMCGYCNMGWGKNCAGSFQWFSDFCMQHPSASHTSWGPPPPTPWFWCFLLLPFPWYFPVVCRRIVLPTLRTTGKYWKRLTTEQEMGFSVGTSIIKGAMVSPTTLGILRKLKCHMTVSSMKRLDSFLAISTSLAQITKLSQCQCFLCHSKREKPTSTSSQISGKKKKISFNYAHFPQLTNSHKSLHSTSSHPQTP